MILVDVNEPQFILDALAVAVPCAREPLNAHGQADYCWDSAEGEEVNIERKTWGELISDVNNVERQLSIYLRRSCSHVVLLMEGLALPNPGGTSAYKVIKRGRKGVLVEQIGRSSQLGTFYAWLHSISQFCEIQHTANTLATAYALTAMYKWDQKPPLEHTTFKRHIRRIEWNPNPQIEMLMNLGHGLGVGEKLATRIISAYGTVWNTVSTTPTMLAEVDGVGINVARKFLRSIGRTDV